MSELAEPLYPTPPSLAPHPYPPCAYGCPLLYGSRSPRLRYPLTAHFAGETMLCLQPRIVAYALDRLGLALLDSRSACGLSSTVLATVLDAHMMANARAATALAFASSAVVFANARAATALA